MSQPEMVVDKEILGVSLTIPDDVLPKPTPGRQINLTTNFEIFRYQIIK